MLWRRLAAQYDPLFFEYDVCCCFVDALIVMRALFARWPLLWLSGLFLSTQRALRLAPDDLLRTQTYRRLWTSVLSSAMGTQIMLLALPLTAAALLHATPTQMGILTAVEVLPFVLLSLPTGVWLDRVPKLPVYIGGELLLAAVAAAVPLAWYFDMLSITGLCVVGFVVGCVHTVSGTAAQIVLTQIVPRLYLVQAHARNSLATSGAEVLGPGLASALIRLVGAPAALLVNAGLLTMSALILRGIELPASTPALPQPRFGTALREGLRFVWQQPLLRAMALMVGAWNVCHYATLSVTILFATRTLGLSQSAVAGCFIALGLGTVGASVLGSRLSRRWGPGPAMVVGMGLCSFSWLVGAMAPAQGAPFAQLSGALFALMLLLFGLGSVLMFIHFLALRQAVTPPQLLGRMSCTIRWLVLAPAAPGALLGAWLAEHVNLRATLLLAGMLGLIIARVAWSSAVMRSTRSLPVAAADQDDPLGQQQQDRMA